MTTDNERHINEDIEARIAAIEDEGLQEFICQVVAFERANLPLSQPQYKETYRNHAAE
jgi:hypothetical protein